MDAREFRIWQAGVGLNGRQTAERLGKSPETISVYRSNGVPPRDSTTVRLAIAAIAAGLEPWKGPKQ